MFLTSSDLQTVVGRIRLHERASIPIWGYVWCTQPFRIGPEQVGPIMAELKQRSETISEVHFKGLSAKATPVFVKLLADNPNLGSVILDPLQGYSCIRDPIPIA